MRKRFLLWASVGVAVFISSIVVLFQKQYSVPDNANKGAEPGQSASSTTLQSTPTLNSATSSPKLEPQTSGPVTSLPKSENSPRQPSLEIASPARSNDPSFSAPPTPSVPIPPYPTEHKGFKVIGTINEKWSSLGGSQGKLGLPTSNETPTFDGVGRFQNFKDGMISWHPETGAHIVWGLIGEKWLALGRERFGYPITDETDTIDGGKFNDFQALHLPSRPQASIYWHPPDTEAYEVYGDIWIKWTELGRGASQLGYPVSVEKDQEGGRIQQFQKGTLIWTPPHNIVPEVDGSQ